MKKTIILTILLVLIYSMPAFSEDKMIIAMIDLEPKGVSKIAADAATNIIRSEFVNIGNFTVVERTAMDEIMKEQGLQMAGCTDQSCAVEVGKLLSAKKIIVGEINKMGDSVLLTLRIINVEKGHSEYSAREKANSIDTIDVAAVKIARNLTQRIVSGEKEFFTPQSPLGYYTRSIVPGWGQVYSGNSMKGLAFGGIFLLSGMALYFQYINYQDKRDAYYYEPLHSDKFDERRNDFKDAAFYYNITLGIVALTYIANWVDIILFSKPNFGTIKSASLSHENNFSINICSRPAKGLLKDNSNISMETSIKF